MAAARLADVRTRYPQPLEVRGAGKHVLEHGAIPLLELVALGERRLRSADALGEPVADALEIAEVEGARARGGRLDACIELDSRKCLGDQSRQLVLEPAYLAAELGARRSLVAAYEETTGFVS